jgi:RNA exonuclease 1
MLKTLYTTFKTLYEPILPTCPTLPADHALKQEEEVYNKTNKQTYRVVCAPFVLMHAGVNIA